MKTEKQSRIKCIVEINLFQGWSRNQGIECICREIATVSEKHNQIISNNWNKETIEKAINLYNIYSKEYYNN